MPIRPLWRNRYFRLVWIGQTASIFGDRVTDIALPWLIVLQTHSILASSFIVAARYLPIIIFGMMTGYLADRLDRKWFMVISDVIRACGLSIIVFIGIIFHTVALWLLVGIVFILGLGQLGFQVAYHAWLSDLTGEELFPNATAAIESSDAMSTLAGPAVGGVLIQIFGSVIALGIDAASYVFSALTLIIIRTPSIQYVEQTTPEKQQHIWNEMLEGGRFILRNKDQRFLKAVGISLYVATASITVLITSLAQFRLHLTAWQTGILFASAGVGGLIGSAIAPKIQNFDRKQGLGRTFCLAAFGAFGLLIASYIAIPEIGFICAVIANGILDGAISTSFIITGSMSTILTPRELRGRANAVGVMYSSIMRGLGLIVIGFLASSNNPAPGFLFLFAGFLIAAIASFQSA